ncbi:MAG: UDP-N-acetylmuramate--L-alanine ligase [Planctomycetaceae bacterium]|nr:UDP-N-acetylmuramate--L-alanine ligase [Planctomycetaceae bacterium]
MTPTDHDAYDEHSLDIHVRLWKQAGRREHVHLVGIGGTGMKALAEFLEESGCSISGSDNSPLPISYLDKGWSVSQGHSCEEIPVTTDLVIYSAAIPADNPALASARERSLPTISYIDVLAALSQQAATYCVAGTHGKSTTAAILAHILDEPARCCGAVIGAETIDREASGWCGDHQRLVLESCEFRRHFLKLDAEHAIITNIERDHLDCYPCLEDVLEAFTEFASQLSPQGKLVIPSDSEAVWRVVGQSPAEVITFGVECPADWRAEDVRISSAGTSFQLFHFARHLGRVTLRIHGRHNVANALAAMALAGELGVAELHLIQRAESFAGIRRRLELIAADEDHILLDDYAHHPTAVRSILEAVRQTYPGRSICCLFQPHQITRTEELFEEFVESLQLADRVVIPPVFAAREGDLQRATECSLRLAAACQSAGVSATAVGSLDQIASTMETTSSPGEIFLTVGAGDIYRIHHELIGRLFRHPESGRAAG